tara:strand:+ start:74 stop:463 length:390 start_codon:yes stop_codon:yes gene_type:complete
MKIANISSTLSCISKCIRLVVAVINKKTIFGLITVIFLGACSAPTALLGPVYTLSSSGNIYQAGLSYSSNALIEQYTGKTPIENLKELSKIEDVDTKNIKEKTLKSEDFYLLVKTKIEKTSKILNLTTQ